MTNNALRSVILEVISENHYGCRTWIGPNQALTIGNSQFAEYALANDPYLAPIHFRISSDHNQCRLAIASDAPVWVNQSQANSTTLHDGDVIDAGGTRFLVRIEGGVQRQTVNQTEQPKPSASLAKTDAIEAPVAAYISQMMGQLGLIA